MDWKVKGGKAPHLVEGQVRQYYIHLYISTTDRLWPLPSLYQLLPRTLILAVDKPDQSMKEDVKKNLTRGGGAGFFEPSFFYGLPREKKRTSSWFRPCLRRAYWSVCLVVLASLFWSTSPPPLSPRPHLSLECVSIIAYVAIPFYGGFF